MARPLKTGIDYFSHDVYMSQDPKIRVLKAKFKLTGYAVYNLLLEEIYRNGYYMEVNDDINSVFAYENGIDVTLMMDIVTFMVQKEIFDSELYKKHAVLTSKRVQKNFMEATKRRNIKGKIDAKFNLIEVSVDSNAVNVNNNLVNVDNNTQSKVKESKVKERMEDITVDDVLEIPEDDRSPMEIWNKFAQENDLSVIEQMTKGRDDGYMRRLRERKFDIDKILELARGQPFLFGDNENGWKLTFDWLIGEKKGVPNYLKILEGNYKSNGNGNSGSKKSRGVIIDQKYINDHNAASKRVDEKIREQFNP